MTGIYEPDRINRIWQHPEYQKCLKAIADCEAQRPFCRHTPEHFLDVARLTYLLALEQGLRVEKELIYAAALLHDIGRYLQYEQGIPHEQASAQIAERILKDCGFTEEELQQIVTAIQSHRTKQEEEDFSALLYRADKLSRNCFLCSAKEACNWSEEKKNLRIIY